MTLEEIETEARQLNPNSRAGRAGKLWNSREALSEAEVERLWPKEAERRNERMAREMVAAKRPDDRIRHPRQR